MSADPHKTVATVAILTATAMLAFAANSLLCRLALGAGIIDAASFASLRMISGAAMLVAIALMRRRRGDTERHTWRSAWMLFLYMACFSFAYLSLGAGMGALILFGAVQLTMFCAALRRGEEFSGLSWIGFALAVCGLVYLLLPGLHAPDLLGALLMTVAGLAWGFYSLLGRSAGDPLQATARNFVYAVPLTLLVSLGAWALAPDGIHVTVDGALLAIASGALASGCGYVVWFAVLPHLAASRAATVQLSVPAIAATGGVLLLGEAPSLRLLLASIATLGGIALVLMQRERKRG